MIYIQWRANFVRIQSKNFFFVFFVRLIKQHHLLAGDIQLCVATLGFTAVFSVLRHAAGTDLHQLLVFQTLIH